MIADAAGRAVAVAPGRAPGLPRAVPLLGRLPGVPMRVAADRGCGSHAFREHVCILGARPPGRPDAAPVACSEPVRNNRNRVERRWARLEDRQAVAARCEKAARSFRGVLHLAAALDRLER